MSTYDCTPYPDEHNKVLHFSKTAGVAGFWAVYHSPRNGDLHVPAHIFGDMIGPEEIFLVLDEYGYTFVLDGEDMEFDPDCGAEVGTRQYLCEYEPEFSLDLSARINFGYRFGARIETEIGGEGYRTCDECDRATPAGEAPDWPNGICPECEEN